MNSENTSKTYPLNAFVAYFVGQDYRVVEILESKKLITVKHRIRVEEKISPTQQETLGLTLRRSNILRDRFDIYKESQKYAFDHATYNAVYSKLIIFLQEFTRHRGWSHPECDVIHLIDNFNIFYNYFYGIFKKENIQVVFMSIPHVTAEIIMYELAKALNIKVHLFLSSPFPNKSFYLNDLSDLGSFPSMQEVLHDDAHFLLKDELETPFYMTPTKKKYGQLGPLLKKYEDAYLLRFTKHQKNIFGT